MLTPAFNDPLLTSFVAQYAQQIDNLCPQLKSVNIRLTDDSDANIPPYLKTFYDKGSKITDTHFGAYYEHQYQGCIYDDIIRFNDIVKGLSDEEQYALLAHEVGHFAAHYSAASLSKMDEELFADQVAVSLGLGSFLRSALIKHKTTCLNDLSNNEDPFLTMMYSQNKKQDIENIEQRIMIL